MGWLEQGRDPRGSGLRLATTPTTGGPLHPREADRLESLRSYHLLDGPRDADFDALAVLAAMGTDAPVALVVLVDAERLFFASATGTREREVPRTALTCCPVTVAQQAPLVVSDLRADPRFRHDEMVVRGEAAAYAGVPLVGRDGLALGTVCVVDSRPRTFTLLQLGALRAIAQQAVNVMELRRLDLRSGNLPTGPRAGLAQPERLRSALDDGELVPWFQPVVHLATGEPAGLEALLRWEHPTEGVLLPAEFLPAVESSGLVLPVGRDVLSRSLALLAACAEDPRLPDALSLAVNVSPVQLYERGLGDAVLRLLDRHGVAPHRLSLELTESAALLDRATARAEVQRLHEAGVRLSLDDYGTGYSNLQRALELPWTTVKLDRGLVAAFTSDPRARRAAAGVMSTFQELGLRVVAEGVETPEQHEVLRDLGCHDGQGHLYGRAVPADEVAGLLLRQAGARAPRAG